ncbi:MAG: class I SAM-dependent methyltransferase [Rhodobacter sp.]|nr:class I SAM-dependent methyltransferase [Rhodobacter sp.]
MRPEDILPTYDRVAHAFARHRDRTLFERRWLDRMLNHTRPPRRVLDLGCGAGQPIAAYLAERRCKVTGVDGAAAMISLFRENLPEATAVHADMRGLDLGQSFDAILAWNSFFHLAPADQRAMFPVFAAHAAPGAVLMFTAGPRAGEPIGAVQGEPVYHASLAPEDYKALLAEHGFELLRFQPEDPDCKGHTIWMARRRGTA